MASKAKAAKADKNGQKNKASPAVSVSNPTVRLSSRSFDDDKDTLAFKVLSADHTKLLLDLEDVDSVQEKLLEILQLEDINTDLKQGVTLDYFVSGFWWAKEQGFSIDQTSTFYTVLHNMLENVKEKNPPVCECMKDFKKLFAGIGVENPEVVGGLQCFDLSQAKLITEYFNDSLFQHYKMYEYVFGNTQDEEIIGSEVIVELPQPAELPWPPPLEEGLQEELYNTYVAPPPETPEPQTEEGKTPAVKTAEELAAEAEHVSDVLSQLTPEEIKRVMNSLFDEMLTGLKADVQAQLRDKENEYINRINKVHRADSSKPRPKSSAKISSPSK